MSFHYIIKHIVHYSCNAYSYLSVIEMEKNKSALLNVLGDTPYNRVLNFLLDEGRTWDYSLSDIARHSKVAWSTFNVIWPAFVKLGIVEKTRIVGKAKMYTLNKENTMTQALIRLDFELSKNMIRGKDHKFVNKIENPFDLSKKKLEDFA